jgi:hypothetical protein
LLAIDAEGYVVWYYHAWSLEAWDFLPDNGVVLVARDDGTKLDGAKTYREDGRTYNGNSQLQEISPLGDIRQQFISACAGSPLNYNMVSHECRVDRATAKKGGAGAAAGVWTTRYAKQDRTPGTHRSRLRRNPIPLRRPGARRHTWRRNRSCTSIGARRGTSLACAPTSKARVKGPCDFC